MRIQTNVERVVIYRNGAMVTRSAKIQSGEWELGPLPLMYRSDSLRLRISSGQITEMREICAFEQTAPESTDAPGDLEPLEAEKRQTQKRIEQIKERIELYESMAQTPDDLTLHQLPQASALCEMHGQISEKLSHLEAELQKQQTLLNENEQRIEAIRNEQCNRRDRARAYRWIFVKAEGATPDTTIEIDYFTSAARWLPCYALLIDGQDATLRMDAFVAQASGEDWLQSNCQVSSADLAITCTLPELPSWRIGLASPAARPAYRPLPGDLETLFEEYDQAKNKKENQKEWRPEPPRMSPPPMMAMAAMAGAAMMNSAPRSMPASIAPMPQFERKAAPARKMLAKCASAPMIEDMCCEEEAPACEDELGEAKAFAPTPTPSADPASLRHAWLRLPGPDEPNRGKLCPVDPLHHFAALIDHRQVDDLEQLRQAIYAIEEAERRLKSLSLPSGTRNIRNDAWRAVYSAHGLRDLPGDGQWHRITLSEQPLPVSFHHRAVPRLQNDVFRFCSLKLPDQPLPAGPLALQIDGAFSGYSRLEYQGSKAQLNVNLGIDPAVRIIDRIVRNQQQDKKGILSQQCQIDTQIELRLRSGLSAPTTLHLYERLPQPAPDQDGLEIELTEAKPQPVENNRDSDGHFVTGALHFELTLPPGELVPLTYSYRIRFPARFELEGGNRRD